MWVKFQQRYQKSHRPVILASLGVHQMLTLLDSLLNTPVRPRPVKEPVRRPILGEHGFSEDQLQDTVGIKPPKLVN
jgi:hypothetical protein